MVFVEFLIVATVFAFVMVAATQVVIPLATSRPVFPAFRRKRRELVNKLTETHNSIDNAKLTQEVKRAKANAERITHDGSEENN